MTSQQEADALLAERRGEMAGEPPEVQLEYRIDCIIRELDELCALAANPETVDLIESQRRQVGTIAVRSRTLLLLLLANRPELRRAA
jgi:hypothetical protein